MPLGRVVAQMYVIYQHNIVDQVKLFVEAQSCHDSSLARSLSIKNTCYAGTN